MAKAAAKPDKQPDRKPAKKPAKSAAKPNNVVTRAAGKILPKKSADTGRKPEVKRSLPTRLWDYLKSVRTELKKVIWPKRPEILSSTVIVIATLIVFAIYIAVLDGMFEGFINLVTGGALPR